MKVLKSLLLICCIFFSGFPAIAQFNNCNDQGTEVCTDAKSTVFPVFSILRSGFDGDPFPGCPANTLDNPSYYEIEVDQRGVYTVIITPSNCPNGMGAQSGLYLNCDPASPAFGVQCACTTGSMAHTAVLDPGSYFILVDGCSGDECEFSIEVTGQGVVPPDISGELLMRYNRIEVCPGEVLSFSIVTDSIDLPSNVAIDWSLPPGVVPINDPPFCETMDVIWGPESGIIEASVTSPRTGEVFSVSLYMPVVEFEGFEYGAYCATDEPGYFYTGASTFFPCGDWEIPLFTERGCDSTVFLTVECFYSETFFESGLVCRGDVFNSQVLGPIVVNQPLDTTIIIPNGSVNGYCDSVMNVFIGLAEPVMEIERERINCNTPDSSFILTAKSIPSVGVDYLWSTVDGNITSAPDQATITVDKLGTYLVQGTVLFSTGDSCVRTNEITLSSEDLELPEAEYSSIPTTCNGSSDGTVTVNITDGIGPFSYAWLGNPGVFGNILTNQPAGPGTVRIKGDNGCVLLLDYLVEEPDTLLLDEGIIQVACNNDGSIEVSASGGTPNYEFVWSNGVISRINSGLQPGSYEVTVVDANNCSATRSYDVPAAITFDIESTFADCDSTGGTATVVNLIGSPNPSYLWSNGATTATASGLIAGGYSVTVSDQVTGCDRHKNVIVSIDTTCTAKISGFVYLDDATRDCMLDASSFPLSNIMVELSSGQMVMTDANGYYEFEVLPGVYDVHVRPFPSQYRILCSSSITVNASNIAGSYPNNNFFLETNSNIDLSLKISKGTARPGRQHTVRICVMNYGSLPAEGTLTFTYDSLIVYLASSPMAISHDPTTREIKFDFTNLRPGDVQVLRASFTTPSSVPIGTSLQYDFVAEPIIGDLNPDDNTVSCTADVRGAFDPNLKMVDPPGEGVEGLITQEVDMLSYELRFMNTGNDTAFDVVIRDLLDPTLNIQAIRPGPSSHYYTARVENGNELVFDFPNILLPDSSENYLGSQGFVFFDIELAEDLPVGTRVTNDAGIYFDFNAPVLTNNTLNTIYRPQVLLDNALSLCYGDSYDGRPLFRDTTIVLQSSSEYVDTLRTIRIDVADRIETNLSAEICQGETYEFDGTLYTDAGNYQAELQAASGCDSTVNLNLAVLPTYDLEETVDLCFGGTFDGQTYTEDAVVNRQYQSQAGCDSLVAYRIVVSDKIELDVSVEICQGDTYELAGVLYTDAGNYQAELQAAGGCDSTVNLNLAVLPTYDLEQTVDLCFGDLFDGQIYTEDAVVNRQYQSQAGCDSLVAYRIMVSENIETTVSAEICQGDTYELAGVLYTDAGNYQAELQAAGGCDSTVNLNLAVLPTYDLEETLDLCYGDLFDGQIYTEDAVVSKQYQSQAGCDSLVAYRIMVSENIETTVSAEICQGDTYELAGLLYTDAGNYQAELQAAEGCDSTVNLNLAVLPTYDLEQIVDLCYGDLFNGQIYTEDAVVDKQYQSQAGCDSLITYRIAVSDKIETNLVANICQGEQYEFGGITYEDAGNYRTTLTAASGCDSTVQLALTVDPSYEVDQIVGLCFGGTFDGQVYTNNATVDRTYQSVAGCDSLVHYDIQVSDDILINIDAAICMGESYQLGAETYTAAGKYTAAFQAVGGCDSTVVVDLAVLPTYEQTAAVSLCYGGQFDGQTYTSDADIQKLFHTVNGCDSLVYYDIDVAELLESDLTASICDGATYALGNETFALAGNYEVVFSAKNGCDSTVHLSLEVAPVYEIEQTVSLCFGGTFDGQVYTSNATVNKQFQSVFGCDSLVQYQIEVFDNIETDVAASICQGETYQLGLETYSQSGNYTAVLQANGGCDSTVMLALEVFPVYEQTQNLELCFGERYNGTAYFADTSLVESYTTAAGCDSNWTIHLQVFDRVVTNLNESVCQGEFFELDGERYGEEGIYTAMFENNSGCDSTVVLELSILPVYESEENITLSPTEPYAGQTFASDTTIVLQLTAINGCDSLATVNISILTTSILTPSFDEEIRLFPNPTTDQSKLQLTGFPSGKIEWFLVDITGKEVWSKQQNHITKEGSFEELLELGDLPPGIYTLILKTDLGVFSRKVLKL